jgi:hypothetical protein
VGHGVFGGFAPGIEAAAFYLRPEDILGAAPVEAAEVFYAFELWILLPDEGGELLARFVCGRCGTGTIIRCIANFICSWHFTDEI